MLTSSHRRAILGCQAERVLVKRRGTFHIEGILGQAPGSPSLLQGSSTFMTYSYDLARGMLLGQIARRLLAAVSKVYLAQQKNLCPLAWHCSAAEFRPHRAIHRAELALAPSRIIHTRNFHTKSAGSSAWRSAALELPLPSLCPPPHRLQPSPDRIAHHVARRSIATRGVECGHHALRQPDPPSPPWGHRKVAYRPCATSGSHTSAGRSRLRPASTAPRARPGR